jgi:glyoxylase-like metal-dependent hydrolase (beta-lactamase superfamily II)
MQVPVTQLYENTWAIEDNGVRIFVLNGTERAMVIDTGMTGLDVRSLAGGLTPHPLFLVNTHADMDHTGSNAQFASFYLHPAEEAVYRRGGGAGEIIPVVEGDTIDLGSRVLEIIHLPGHTPGSIAVLDRDHRVLISGDPIQRNGRIFMFGPHRDMHAYIESLHKLEGRISEFDEIWPSHADIPVTTDTIRLLADGAEAILAGNVQGVAEEMHGHRITAYDLGFCTILGEG